MTQLQLCNLALGHLGEAVITDINASTTAARACLLNYGPTRDEVLRSHRWNFAIKRARLTQSFTAITGAADDGDGLIEVTKASHGLTTGTRILLRDIVGVEAGNGQWLVTSTGTDTFTLDGATFSGTYSSGGEFVIIPSFAWDFQYTLPTDCLRCLEVNDSEVGDWISDEWIIEGRKILTNADTVNLVYVRTIDVEEITDPLFAQAFAAKLAAVLSEVIRGSTGKTADLLATYQSIIAPQARRIDANEGRRRKGMLPFSSSFIRSRFSS